MNDSMIYALDFDGVICDSATETAISGWKAAGQIWPDMNAELPIEMLESFRQVRPVIETGYEAILTMRLLYLGHSLESIFDGYSGEFDQLMQAAQIDSDQLKKLFGDTRDQWISTDLDDWTRQNPLYPGVVEKLQRLSRSRHWYVITTKQERFVKAILAANQIELSADRIFGLDRNMSKPEILKILLQRHPGHTIHFVEDRLPALQKVRQTPELASVECYFALWGYNRDLDKLQAEQQGFTTHTLEAFLS